MHHLKSNDIKYIFWSKQTPNLQVRPINCVTKMLGVGHLYSASIFFWQIKKKKKPPTVWHPTWQVYQLGKSHPLHLASLPNYWRWALFLLGIYFLELANHKIYQAEFAKLLEIDRALVHDVFTEKADFIHLFIAINTASAGDQLDSEITRPNVRLLQSLHSSFTYTQQ